MALENLSFGFLKPNILGTTLYDETALPDKLACMENAARDTTSFEMGLRLTGLLGIDFILFLSAT
jgi:1D-myo-inositol-tetrakisphosphate 5-kinase/inositol-polyphosphate multikinase